MDELEPPSPPRASVSRTSNAGSRNYAVGIGLLLIVVGLWVGSSFLMSSMFRDEQWNRPWLVTYICTSSFTFYLIPPALSYCIKHGLRAIIQRENSNKQSNVVDSDGYPYTSLDSHGPSLNRTGPLPGRATAAYSTTESPLNTRQIANLASTFVLLWFAANWSVNAALGYTSVSSTTILSSMSGFFTLAIGVVTGTEKFSLGRLVAVVTSVIGVILVSNSDHKSLDKASSDSVPHWILGDALALTSAALYALYVILMKVKVKEESRVDIKLFFGFVGAINLLCFWPMGIFLHYSGVEPFELPRTNKLWLSVVINMFCTFVSDYVYMLAMLKTSPLVVTVGISLTLPVAVIGDVFKGIFLPATSFLGAALVLSSFIILSLNDRN